MARERRLEAMENSLTFIYEELLEMRENIKLLDCKMEKFTKTFSSGGENIAHLYKVSPNVCMPPNSSKVIPDLCSHLSLPGLRFFKVGRHHWVHRFCWIFIHISALFISYSYITTAYNTWQSSPTVLSKQSSLTNVSDIPFPAVTFCKETSLSNSYNQTDQLLKCFRTEKTVMAVINRLQAFHDYRSSWLEDLNLTYLDGESQCTEEEIITLQMSLMFSPKDIFYELRDKKNQKLNTRIIDGQMFISKMKKILKNPYFYRSEHKNVTENMFSYKPSFLLNDSYICKTYNSLPHNKLYKEGTVSYIHASELTVDPVRLCHWIPENMLTPDCIEGFEPLYSDSNIHMTLSDDQTKRLAIGIHNPAVSPSILSMNMFYFNGMEDVDIYLTPKLIVAPDDLEMLEVSKRGCLFSYEKELSMFKFYTQKNCLLENQVNISIMMNGCVPSNLPRPNTTVPVCGKVLGNYFFIQESFDLLYSYSTNDCPPDCISLSYKLEMKKIKKLIPRFTRIVIGFKNAKFSSTFRHSVNSYSEFLAYSIGILGVFNGFSLMVVWEILYLVTVRLWSSVRMAWRTEAEQRKREAELLLEVEHP